MNAKNLIILIFIAFTFNYSHGQSKLDHLVKKFYEEGSIPGVCASLITIDSIYSSCYGYKNIQDSMLVSSTSKFHLGSNTKAITSMLIAKSIELDLFDWDSRIIDIYPDISRKIHPKFHNVTVHDLLTHSGGLAPYTEEEEYKLIPDLGVKVVDKRYNFTIHTLTNDTIYDTGQLMYSNGGYIVATSILEQQSKKAWENLIDEFMNQMELDYIIGFPNKVLSSDTWGHISEGDTIIATSPDYPYELWDYLACAGDISMDISDYSKLIQENLKGILGKSNYLQKDTYELIHFGQQPYAYGWGNGIVEGDSISTHNGSGGTFFCHTFINKSKERATVIMTNVIDPKLKEMIIELRRSILKIEH